MAVTNNIDIRVDGQSVDIGAIEQLGIHITFGLEEPENFENKQGAYSLGVTLPATPTNDLIFNSFHNPAVMDTTGTDYYRKPRKCEVLVNGVRILSGKLLLQSASHSRVPEGYQVDIYGSNADWVIDMKDLTLWDCTSADSHTFNLGTVEESWSAYDYLGLEENQDYVYAPVRYRQPFGNDDNAISIYHLRPALSVYWLLKRAFRQFGYRIDSQFIESEYFKRMVLPWVWGDFYDINGIIAQILSFKAVGPAPPDPTGHTFPWSGTQLQVDNTIWDPWDGASTVALTATDGTSAVGPGGLFVNTVIQDSTFGGTDNVWRNFAIYIETPPYGHDDLGVFSFQGVDGFPYYGSMQYRFAPPAAIRSTISTVVTLTFQLDLIIKTQLDASGTSYCYVTIQTDVISAYGDFTVWEQWPEVSFNVGDGPGAKGTLSGVTRKIFTVPGVHMDDVVVIRVRYDTTSGAAHKIAIASSTWVDASNNIRSSIELLGMQVALGGDVNFRWYDKLRSYKFLDLFRGLIDAFNLSVQTNPIERVITIEPTHTAAVEAGGADITFDGYYVANRLDWTDKLDLSKNSTVVLYSSAERQMDFQYKLDGSDGGQNVYAARYKGIYLNNLTNTNLNNTNLSNGITAGVPGAARFMFPSRFQKGQRNYTNRFFSSTMHVNYAAWAGLADSEHPAPQLIAILPENVSGGSAEGITGSFEPKLAYYAGIREASTTGSMRYIGDPADPYSGGDEIRPIPLMFSVNYGTDGQFDPILTYCDQVINEHVKPGLAKRFFAKRLGIMEHGKMYKAYMRLTLGDITNFEHRNPIIINGMVYYLIAIDNYNPLNDDSCLCTFWQANAGTPGLLDRFYPSYDSITTDPPSLAQYDLKYAPMLVYGSDLPQ